jgi:hypothetical protein
MNFRIIELSRKVGSEEQFLWERMKHDTTQPEHFFLMKRHSELLLID